MSRVVLFEKTGPADVLKKEAATYLEKAASMFTTTDIKAKVLKSQAYYLLGDIYHYGLVSLTKAKDDYQMAVNILPQNKSAQNELDLIEKEKPAETK